MSRLLIFVVLLLGPQLLECVPHNGSCPSISPRNLDLKQFDGKWFLDALASDLKIQGDCAMITFNHKQENTTDLEIKWMTKDKANFYNGTVMINSDNSTGETLTIKFSDEIVKTYSFLDLHYDHFAVLFNCIDKEGNTSSVELWHLSREPHMKNVTEAKIAESMEKYDLQDVQFVTFNNSEICCRSFAGILFGPLSLTIYITAFSFLLLLF